MHPLADLTVPAGAVAIHWFEQSCYAVKDEHGTIVQIDPYFPRERPADRFIYPDPPLDEARLPTDFVLLTHDHRDHTWPESLERIRQRSPRVKMGGQRRASAMSSPTRGWMWPIRRPSAPVWGSIFVR